MFCEGCPNQGEMKGDFDQIAISKFYNFLGGRLMLLCDEGYLPAEPLQAPRFVSSSGEAIEFLQRAIAMCDGPNTEAKGLLRRREIITSCGSQALRSLRIKNSRTEATVKERVQENFALMRVKKGIIK